ncbi:sarcosine oxidase subunit delta [Acidithiobacillus ferriphilus]|uniref:sarcosine oxidase subunit delta n=1 Tax=Acidithiobacillus ferriphilus TaxID=1689834 RepID=UPI00232B77A0|nr:sarcosine oxidase subunit delta [Acidithiobacillus ferriphilus]WCE93191.1 sarcosine oxidase subunit delta [Acidithiobacillus ferriphilus]
MKMIACPIQGLRPVSEFFYWGEVRDTPDPDPDTCTDQEWADYVFNRNGVAGIKKEWWCHIPSNTWFIAERNTVTDQTVRTFLYGEDGRC